MELVRTRKKERGMALVLVLLLLSVLTAMVVEFAYGIYVNTSLLTNWQRLQEISMAAESGVSMGAGLMKSVPQTERSKNVLRQIPIPPMDPFKLGIKVSAIVEDENSKLNIDMIVDDFGKKTNHYTALAQLLKALDLDEVLADRISDHIYSIANGRSHFQSVEELLLVAGIDREVYNTLSPYITVHSDGKININTAEIPVLRSLGENITRSEAEEIFNSDKKPFKDKSALDFTPVIGPNYVSVEGGYFKITSKAMDADGLTREIHCVINIDAKVQYWREL